MNKSVARCGIEIFQHPKSLRNATAEPWSSVIVIRKVTFGLDRELVSFTLHPTTGCPNFHHDIIQCPFRSSERLFSKRFPNQNSVCTWPSDSDYISSPSEPRGFHYPNSSILESRSFSCIIQNCQLLSFVSGPNVFLNNLFSRTCNICSSLK